MKLLLGPMVAATLASQLGSSSPNLLQVQTEAPDPRPPSRGYA